MASVSDPRARQGCQIALSFREELHAIEAILAGQGIALCSDVVVADDIASGALIKAFDLSLFPGTDTIRSMPPITRAERP